MSDDDREDMTADVDQLLALIASLRPFNPAAPAADDRTEIDQWMSDTALTMVQICGIIIDKRTGSDQLGKAFVLQMMAGIQRGVVAAITPPQYRKDTKKQMQDCYEWGIREGRLLKIAADASPSAPN